jgi:nicotinate phosphoribosyltransferase
MMRRSYGLATDLYQLTMAAAYFENQLRSERAVFELFVRRIPEKRSFLLAVGLQQALEYLENLHFEEDEIRFISTHPAFQNASYKFFEYLKAFRFTGDVWAMPEGTAFFSQEPILRVEAPIIEAQIVETSLLAIINFQSMIASKAVRLVNAARGRNVIEFGTRRAHGTEAGLLAARAAYIAGCAGTSNVEAGYLFGIPTFGTLAHSFIMSFNDEREAFAAFLKTFPTTATILVDTFDTIEAVKMLARDFHTTIPAIRLDSGNLLNLSIQAREILDKAGMHATKIVASNELNEYLIADLLANGAKIDAFGVGTQLATSFDSPALSGVYKLVGLIAHDKVTMKMKSSPGKVTYPGEKQVWRGVDGKGEYVEDVIALWDEEQPGVGDWHSLLSQVMKGGKTLNSGSSSRSIEETRVRVKGELNHLPVEFCALESKKKYSVRFSEQLVKEKDQLLQHNS